MQIFNLAFAFIALLGLWLPVHGATHIAVGLACHHYASAAYGYLAAVIGVVELILLWMGVPCLLLGEQGTVHTYARRPHEGPWKRVESKEFDNTSTDPTGWVIAAAHSFALAGLYAAGTHFGLFAVRLG
jgi:hypothetical protein